jgi:hypothetical protein
MAVYDTYITTDFAVMKEEEEVLSVIRDLAPGKYKYRSMFAKFKVSKDPKKYADTLWIRLGRGQLVPTPCSIQVIEMVNVIPPGL